MMPGPASWNLDQLIGKSRPRPPKAKWRGDTTQLAAKRHPVAGSLLGQGKADLLRNLQERHTVAGSLRRGAHEGFLGGGGGQGGPRGFLH